MHMSGWIAIIGLFVAISIIAHHLFLICNGAREKGMRVLERLEVNPILDNPRIPWIVRIGRTSHFIMPLVEQLFNTPHPMIRQRITNWQSTLIRGGYGTLIAPIHLMLSTINSAIFGGAILAILFALYFNGDPATVFIGMLLGSTCGGILPTILINHLATVRIGLIEKRLPFAIEFMLLSMEASSSFPRAMRIYTDQIKDDPLTDELEISLLEIESGLSVLESLERLAGRLQSSPVTSFILALTTGIETGQPIHSILKVQADTSRQHRFQSAEEIAKKAGSQALFPLLLSMIAVMILLIGPLLIMVFKNGLL